MPHKLTEKALLLCNRGTVPSELKVTSQDFSKFENKLIATEQDNQGETNIQSFGVCTVTRGRCTRNPFLGNNPQHLMKSTDTKY